ncbi:PilC/PilY family type IV pilus protein [uncultured Thiohalocapsa sp.]|uniref:pilus assembly protein n=1 Tax=uncultured Thiohalocapsa sp. TaxID=768990 RepID=UPI0025FD3FBC|nr:PilC/PilY family type IV pilus protein [uncultured Thiohalocapsa sp.]
MTAAASEMAPAGTLAPGDASTAGVAAAATVAGAAVAVTAGALPTVPRIFQAVSRPDTGSGELRSLRLATGREAPGHACHGLPRGALCDTPNVPYQSTRVATAFRPAAERVIFTWAAAAGEPVPFNAQSVERLSVAQQQALTADEPQPVVAGDVIAWLRGAEVAGLRQRETLLGDLPIGHLQGSGPLVVGPPRQLFRDARYAAFRAAHKDRPLMVYLGANDGMLHAFDADASTTALVEAFAYVPAAVYAGLADLTHPAYGSGDRPKRAFVAGALSYSDAELPDVDADTNPWRSILVGSFGAGAQGVFALDVTDPHPPNTAAAARDLVLWEFTDASGHDDGLDGRDMGYTAGKPAIVRIDDTDNGIDDPVWVVLVGNGGGNRNIGGEDTDACAAHGDGAAGNCTISQTGNAVLYVLNLAGDDAQRIRALMDTGAGADDVPSPAAGDGSATCIVGEAPSEATMPPANGLGEVSTLDEDGDLVADRAYAGDLFGNLWRFDLTDLDAAPVRLFTATDAAGNCQPITSRIAFARHPNGGHLLLFGTGRPAHATDQHAEAVQTFYGIWDTARYWRGGRFDVPARRDLLAHAFIQDDAGVSADGQVVSLGRISTAVPTRSVAEPRGWMLDLQPVESNADCRGSERVLSAPQVRHGRVVFVSMRPDGGCGDGGASWINALDAIDGSRPAVAPFDANLDGQLDAADLLRTQTGDSVVASSLRVVTAPGAGRYSAPTLIGVGGGKLKSVFSTSAGHLIQLEEANAHGWRTWLQLD